MKYSIEEIIENLNDVACCPYHDRIAKDAVLYIGRLQKENELLKENLKVLKEDIFHLHNDLISLEEIMYEETKEDIVVI